MIAERYSLAFEGNVSFDVNAEFMKLTNDLPGALVGLDAPQMQAVIREHIIEILTRLSDETSTLYTTEL